MKNNNKTQMSRNTNLTGIKDNRKPRIETVGLSSLVTSRPQKSRGKQCRAKFKMLQLAWFQNWLNDKETHRPEAGK